MVNQQHPFKLLYSAGTNRPAGNGTQTELKAEKGRGKTNDDDVNSSPNLKRTIKDFFTASPMKVIQAKKKSMFSSLCVYIFVKMLKFYIKYDSIQLPI